MPQTCDPPQTAGKELPSPDLKLLVVNEPWLRTFVQNYRDLFRPSEFDPHSASCAPATFWPDVFVERKLPWPGFSRSAATHVLAIALIWAATRFLALQPHPRPQSVFTHADVVYYSPSEYLPPLDTRRSSASPAAKADPEYSPQPIISVPPEADNRAQTIVAPPKVRLRNDIALPNSVAMLEKLPIDSQMPIAPAPAVPVSEITRLAPRMDRSIIAPPAEVGENMRDSSQAELTKIAVIPPPPSAEANATRRLGDFNIGHASVIAPAPQLALHEQRAFPTRGSDLSRPSAAAIAPPPSLSGRASSRAGGASLALSLHPAVGAPPSPAAGNRRGTFAATPEGHRGASGAPGSSAADNSNDRGSAGKSNAKVSLPTGFM